MYSMCDFMLSSSLRLDIEPLWVSSLLVGPLHHSRSPTGWYQSPTCQLQHSGLKCSSHILEQSMGCDARTLQQQSQFCEGGNNHFHHWLTWWLISPQNVRKAHYSFPEPSMKLYFAQKLFQNLNSLSLKAANRHSACSISCLWIFFVTFSFPWFLHIVVLRIISTIWYIEKEGKECNINQVVH